MSDEKKPDNLKDDKVDSELSNLLDSALEDFKQETPNDDKSEIPEVSAEWSDDFIKQAAAQFEQNFATLLGANADLSADQIQEKLQQMAEAAQQVVENPIVSDSSNDFASTISQTIQGLSAGAEGLQNPISEQHIMELLGGQGDQNAFLPFMQGMMQSLLSKEVLYPSLKDILDKFPEWLEKNKTNLSQEEAERFNKQKKLMEEICEELEKEKNTDSDDEKKQRFEKVLNLMQKLQDYGQPPTDLVGEVGPPLPLDIQNGVDPNQCNVM